ncbi:MAG: hypothetical protein V7736_12700 [Colwellia polaris]|jgi:hypothetical protein|uniref:hypothetical protein n=1 Tax=Colwellia polaris TaxID=326537 RepID=UPI000A16D6B3|nr:hypothetical protein [Colwellia polaris]|tara:strand:- start:3986 stop:4747 length:762 start_codon:yes stop_codon:yes gene_type:complete
MKIIAALLFTLPLTANANECKISADVISAYYQLDTQITHQNMEQPPVKQLFELHRNHNQILQRNVSKGVNDIWSLYANRLSLSRVFDKYQHIIDYQPNELRYQPQWQDVYQLVAIPAFNQMQLVEQKGSGCLLEEHYVLKGQVLKGKVLNGDELKELHNGYQLVWLPKLGLVKSLTLQNGQLTQQWQLTKYQQKDEKMPALFKQYETYQTTDYADVGDNEGIPFLAKMINQGFSMPISETRHNAAITHSGYQH